MTLTPTQIRRAIETDRALLDYLLDRALYKHTHPDWQTALDWLGKQPFYVSQRGDFLQAALAAPADPPDTAWLRLAAFRYMDNVDFWLKALWPLVRADLMAQGVKLAGVMVLDGWLEDLLPGLGFQKLCEVITLRRLGGAPPAMPEPNGITLRRASLDDIAAMTALDNAAFQTPWQYSATFITQALEWSAYGRVAEANGEIIGYQLSTGGTMGGHLARLAVLPGWQGRGVGRWLTLDMLRYFDSLHAPSVTVNTQSDNLTSQRLYTGLGFEFTGESNPVWVDRL